RRAQRFTKWPALVRIATDKRVEKKLQSLSDLCAYATRSHGLAFHGDGQGDGAIVWTAHKHLTGHPPRRIQSGADGLQCSGVRNRRRHEGTFYPNIVHLFTRCVRHNEDRHRAGHLNAGMRRVETDRGMRTFDRHTWRGPGKLLV